MNNTLIFDNIRFSHSIDKKPNPSKFKMHTHKDFELLYFINGKGSYYVEGNKYPLLKGDILLLNAAESHYIDISSEYPYERCVINFSKEFIQKLDNKCELLSPFINRPFGKNNIYRRNNFNNDNCYIFLENMLKDSNNKELQITTNFFALLNELKNAKIENSNGILEDNIQIYQIIRYINENLRSHLTLDTICEKFFISKSQLCRMFKKFTGSTVLNYIETKRLLLAEKLISSGSPATKIFNECGYSDYSVFYRAFKKHFGYSPKSVLRKT